MARLDHSVTWGYSDYAAAKSTVGINSPNITRAPEHAHCVFFVGVALAHPQYGGLGRGIARCAGFSSSRSVNPVQVATTGLTALVVIIFTTRGLPIMATFLPVPAPQINIVEGKAVTTSLAVAEYFGKRHADVLRKIESLDCSPEFTATHFCAHEKINELGLFEKSQPYYQITRDGFTFLAMGFTGKKAASFKEAYIAEFNRMEATLRTPVVTPASPVTINCSPNRIHMRQMFAGGWCIQLNALLAALMNAEVQGQAVRVTGVYQAWAELDSLCAELEKHLAAERRH